MAIVDFQLFLLKKIKAAEAGLKKCKGVTHQLRLEKSNDRPSKERSKAIDEELKAISTKKEKYNFIIYIWRCFGDGIVFSFCDKYAIKHLLYDRKYREKETAGFISGKDGLKNELYLIKEAASNDVPAVLCDLTNTLRHGDVCLLGVSDPYPIEVKSSPKINERGERQIRNIAQINQFFKTDRAENFRNQGVTLRIEHIGREKNHLKKINDCIGRSYTEGTSRIKPEQGICYIAITDFKEEILDVQGKYIHAISLNDYKNKMQWHPYTPFTTLLNPEHIFNFIDGRLIIIILLDLQIIKNRYKKSGMNIRFLNDGTWYAQITESGDILKGGFRVSEQSFLRLAFEFQSLTWLIKQHKKELGTFTQAFEDAAEGLLKEIPKDWFDIEDGIPD